MDRAHRLKTYMQTITRHGGIEAIRPASREDALKSMAPRIENVAVEAALEAAVAAPPVDPAVAAANAALEKLKFDMDAELAQDEMFGLEAIILKRERPAADVVRGDFRVEHDQWLNLNDGDPHKRLLNVIPSIGRIDLPGQSRIPYGGTGFIVGAGLMMTNRHVAAIFADGLGAGPLAFRSGFDAAADFLHERGRTDAETVHVRAVRMIHPYWDMALLEIEGPAAKRTCLNLSLQDADDLDGRRVVVIGYPAFDPLRNDVALQNQIFSGVYGVKRLQPGLLHARRDVESFGKMVRAATHDCSTLGGNSGSAVIDIDSGEVLALHFGGRYLDTNYCVPAFELARDGRVVDAGVVFAGRPGGGIPAWQGWWDQAERTAQMGEKTQSGDASSIVQMHRAGGGEITFTVPLTITVKLGQPVGAVAVESVAMEEGLAEVWHAPDLENRKGYDPKFLGDDIVVPMPEAADPRVIAPLLDGGTTLNYRHFSVQMHGARRIALFTASNVTAEPALKKPEADRKYDRKTLTGLGKNDQEKWFPDPRLAPQYQLSDKFYTKDDGAFDKGHIVRREDVAWGETYDELREGNGDTYHVTNCSPQIAQYNQSQRGVDNWGDLENLVLGQAASERYCLFAGPILDKNDDSFLGVSEGSNKRIRVRIPKAFWKVVVARTAKGIAAYAFVLDQDLSDVPLEFVVSSNFRRRMVSIADLEQRTGVVFDKAIHDADQWNSGDAEELVYRGGIERGTLSADDAGKNAP